ncbi:TauD/TfdA family dioxygenase [Escherichia coli]
MGPYIGAQISGADLTRPLSDNQFEQLYHAVLRHRWYFCAIKLLRRSSNARWPSVLANCIFTLFTLMPKGLTRIIVLDTHNDNPPDNDNWHTDVTFIETPPAGAILAAKELPSTGGDTLWTSGIAAYEALSVALPPAAERAACGA